MKIFCLFLTILTSNICFGNAYHHEFEGISQIYNIRFLRGLDRFLPEQPVIVEAGAYQGNDTVKLAAHFPLAKIYIFEPLKTIFPKLLDKIQPFPNVQAMNLALSNSPGLKKFYICHGRNGQSPIFEFHSSLLKPTKKSKIHLMGPVEKVDCVSLSDWCRENQISKIDMLLLSTEGNELQILDGAKDLLKEISLIYVCTQHQCTRENMATCKDIMKFMKSHGFTLLSHFYIKDAIGDALFVKTEKFNTNQ